MITHQTINKVPRRVGGVYTLSYNGRAFYVGESRNLRNRVSGHVGYARRGGSGAMYSWMHDVMANGGVFHVHVLLIAGMAWRPAREFAESAWIDYFARRGMPLFNVRTLAHGKHKWFVDEVLQIAGEGASTITYRDAILVAIERYAKNKIAEMRDETMGIWTL